MDNIKKSKKTKCFVIIIVVILIALVSVLLYLFVFRKLNAKKCLNSTLDSIKTCDFEDGFYYTDANGIIKDRLTINELEYYILTNSDIKVKEYDFDWREKSADVKLEITYPDVYSIYQEQFSKAEKVYTSDEINTYLINSIKNDQYNSTTETIRVTIIKQDDKWYLIENEELMNYYSGGLYIPFKEMLNNTFNSLEG